MTSENPYEAAFPTEPEPEKSRVPWLALIIMLGAALVCFAGIAYFYRMKAMNTQVKRALLDEQAARAELKKQKALEQNPEE